MKNAPLPNLFSIRQADLFRKISEALEISDAEKISIYKNRWVHRYGINSFPNDLQNDLQVESSHVGDSDQIQEVGNLTLEDDECMANSEEEPYPPQVLLDEIEEERSVDFECKEGSNSDFLFGIFYLE